MSWTFPKPEVGYDDLEHALAEADAAGSLVLRLVVGERALDHRLVDRMLDVPELGQLYAGDPDPRPVELVIDLADCTFLDPYASTVIHSLVTHVAQRTERIWVCLPVRDRVRAYCGGDRVD